MEKKQSTTHHTLTPHQLSVFFYISSHLCGTCIPTLLLLYCNKQWNKDNAVEAIYNEIKNEVMVSNYWSKLHRSTFFQRACFYLNIRLKHPMVKITYAPSNPEFSKARSREKYCGLEGKTIQLFQLQNTG